MAAQAVNRANEALRTQGYSFGTMVGLVRNPLLIRYIADAGYDSVSIDTEHSSFGLATVSTLAQMARACGITPVVRLAEVTRENVQRVLDLGALGVMIHDVERPEQVEELLEWSVGSKFAGRTGDAEAARQQLTIAIQIESRAGVERIDEILGAGHVDLVYVGRGDLALSLGHPLDREHPDVLEALSEIVAGCNRHDVTPGLGVISHLNEAETTEVVGLGFRWLDFGTDKHLLRRGYADGIRMLRQAAA